MSEELTTFESEYLTPQAIEKIFSIPVQTLANWRWKDEGPDYYKTGKGKGARIIYKREDVEEWLESRRHFTGRVRKN